MERQIETDQLIKNCPFCGYKPIILCHEFDPNKKSLVAIYRIFCKRCEIGFSDVFSPEKEAVAIESLLSKWNKRNGKYAYRKMLGDSK